MKIIDLLNKIANGEEVPKKIKYGDEKFVFSNKTHQYYVGDNSNDINTYYNNSLKERLYNFIYLNDEVEIIEEDKPAIAREELENRIENALEFLETQYNTFPNGEMWRKALKNVLKGKEPDDVYKPFLEEDKKIEKLNTDRIFKRKYLCDDISIDFLKADIMSLSDKINELIDKVNNMENNK